MSTFKKPYPYQERVAQYLLAGRSVILQAPTGAGKTAAALLPFLHARKILSSTQFPRKCIYSVPMKVLANQFEAEYKKIITRYGWQDDLLVTIQTGDRPDDPQVEGDLVFTTIDQTLSNFLNIPYGVSGRLANVNAGAVLSSYLVFDELHLYDPDTTLPTVLEMLQMLTETTPFVVMTATFSSTMLERLARLLNAVVIPEDAPARESMMQIGAQIGKDRRFFAVDSPLTAESVLAHDFQRTICICNTVRSAQKLYEQLRQKLDERGDVEIMLQLLHSRFYKADRDTKEAWIREQFGKPKADYSGKRLIQIATQVIEVGVDATCDVMHTELSPASSLLQRAGRCARRANEQGVIYVYLPRDEDNEPDYTPYFLKRKAQKTARGRRLCEATWTALNMPQFTGVHMSFALEQALIDAVHTPVDGEILTEIEHLQHDRRDKMLRAMREQDRGLAAELIRDVDNRFVFARGGNLNEDENLLRNPWYYDGFSLTPGSVTRAFNELQILDFDTDEIPWLMQTPAAVTDEETPANQPPTYRWSFINDGGEAYRTAVVAVHPGLVKYDQEMGFRFDLSDGSHQSHKREVKKKWARYSYKRESFAEHVAGLYGAYCNRREDHLPLREEIAFVVQRLECELPRFGLQPGLIDQMCRAMFACHDLGKLSVEWQKWAHTYQERIGMSLPDNYMAAHTDYNPDDEKQWAVQKEMWKRPNHAGESAMAVLELFGELCGDSQAMGLAAVTAVARHHSAATCNYQPYTNHPAAQNAVIEALIEVGLQHQFTELISWKSNIDEQLSEFLIDFDSRNLEETFLYFLLVRVLRLADQRSQVR